jgi:chromate transporter
MTAIATVIFVRTDTNPLIVVGAAAVLGYLGFI